MSFIFVCPPLTDAIVFGDVQHGSLGLLPVNDGSLANEIIEGT
jgi:hypothetical protein